MDIETIRVVLPVPQVIRISILPQTIIGVAVWGGITGTLSDQTDLQVALDAKLDIVTPLPATPTNQREIVTLLQQWGLCASILFAFMFPAVGAEFQDIPSNLTIGAGQSVRRNAGNTLFEAYTPGSGGGTVTSFSAGTLSPLFTTSVANATTTPALSFTLSNAAAHTFFANNTGSSGAPSFTSFVAKTDYWDTSVYAGIDRGLVPDPPVSIPSCVQFLDSTGSWTCAGGGGTSGAAPDDAHYITTQAESGLTAEFSLGSLTTGLLKHTVSVGVSTPATAIAGTDYEVPVTASKSITRTTNDFTLTNDSTTPGNSKYYGTDSGGTRGYFALPTTITGSALTKTDDTNVTLTLGGSPTTALVNAASVTVGWTGQLSLARGGTGTSLSDPNADKILAWDDTDGTNGYWTVGTGLTYTHATHTLSASGGAVGGSDTQVQFNDGGSFGGDTALIWDKTGNILTLGVAGSIVGELDFKNATSGTISLKPSTGALGTSVLTLPIATDTLIGKATTDTVTNKRVTKRALSTSGPGGTPTLNTDTYDVAHFTAVAAAITSMTTNLSGTPVQGDQLRIDFTDDGTARAITWGASFENGAVALPTTTVANVRLDTIFYWNTVTTKWRIMANSASTGTPGGSDTQVQYNNAGAFAGITGATTNGTALTLVAPVLGTPASGVMTNVTGTASALNIGGSAGSLSNVGAALSTSDTTVNNQQTPTTGGVTLASQTLAAGSIWWIRAWGDYVAASSATTRNLEMQPNWAGTNLTKVVLVVKTSSAATTSWNCELLVVGTSTTAAWVSGTAWGPVSQALATTASTATSASNTSLSSGAQTLDFRVDTSASVVGDSIVVKGVLMTRIK